VFCWRIVKEKYAGRAFDGEGARRKGGRWTPKGFPVVYTAQTESLAALELFMQLGDEGREMKFACIRAEIPDGLKISEIDLKSLPLNWRESPAPETLKRFGADWLEKGESAVLKAPSSLTSSESNFILNPLHPDFKKIRIGKAEKYCYDPRMWKRG
jgi:RES domain-containing protein